MTLLSKKFLQFSFYIDVGDNLQGGIPSTAWLHIVSKMKILYLYIFKSMWFKAPIP
jgi:hypothetical protein